MMRLLHDKNCGLFQSIGRMLEPDSVTKIPYFLKFSIINLKFDTTRTKPMRLRKPRNDGATFASWLRHDVRLSACTANVCLYFLDALLSGFSCFGCSSFNGIGWLPLMDTLSAATPFDNSYDDAPVAVFVEDIVRSRCYRGRVCRYN